MHTHGEDRMALVHMKRVDFTTPTQIAGALYQEEIIVDSGTESENIYLFPFTRVYDIALQLEGDGAIEVSNSSIKKLESGNGIFKRWDGISRLNLALVAFRVTRVSGIVQATISVKTDTV